MTDYGSWIYQGRQAHGYFGTGTAPKEDTDSASDVGAGDLFHPANAGQRVDYVESSLMMHVPRNDRGRWDTGLSDASRTNLKTAVAAWYGARDLSRDAFRTRFLDPYTSDDLVDRLRSAARGMVEGRSYDNLAKAGQDLAAAAQKIGVDTWPRFLGNASRQAVDAVSGGTIPGVVKISAMDQPAGIAGLVVLGFLAILLGRTLDASRSGPSVSGPTIVEQRRQKDSKSTAPSDVPDSSPPQAIVSEDRRRHILDGDNKGGGHGPGRNQPGKSEFPPGWSDDHVIEEIESVANDPASSREPAPVGRTVVTGSREGVDILVIVDGDGKSIITGCPTNVTRNPKRNSW